MSKIVTWRVTGMTCHGCETRIGDVLRALPGVTEIEVSLKQGKAGVQLQAEASLPDLTALNQQLADYGYRLAPDRTQASDGSAVCVIPSNDTTWRKLGRAALAVTLVSLLAAFIVGPLRSLVPNVSAGASVGALFLFGLVASVSTCLASTGGLMLAYNGTPRTKMQLIGVHVGRLVAFVVGGVALGTIGRALPAISSSAYGVFGLVLGIGFLIVGLNMLELAPSAAAFGLALPRSWTKFGERISVSRNRFAPFAIGAVTFILPCGFTQTAQALALASGSPLRGAFFMGAFALGTLPVLAGLSAFGSAGALKHRAIKLATGAVLSIFALGQINGGLTVLGSPVTPGTLLSGLTSRLWSSAVAQADAKEQTVRMTVEYGTYQPKNLTVHRGVPVRWEIDGKDISGCAGSIVAPTLGIKKDLAPGLNVLAFTPDQTGTIPFSCGMGMIHGSLTVIN